MRKPTYPRIQGRHVTTKTEKGYKTYYNCRDLKNYKKTCAFKSPDYSSDDLWWSKMNYSDILIDQFVYEDKKTKATVKVFHNKKWVYTKYVSGKIFRLDEVKIMCNKWRTTKETPTPFAPTGYRCKVVHGGCTPTQAKKWVKSLAENKDNIRQYNKALRRKQHE